MLSLRPLSQIEKILWRLSDVSSMNFTMVTRCLGPLLESTLRAALDAVQDQHPFLQVRIEETPAGPVFQNAGVPQIPLQIPEASNTGFSLDLDAINAWIEEELVDSIPWEKGPLVRCTWIRHADEVHHLLFTFHHAIGDGMSGILFLRDLFKAMESGASASSPVSKTKQQVLPLAIDQRCPKRARGWRGFLLSVKTVMRFYRQDHRLGPIVEIPIDSGADTESQRTYVLTRPFDTSFTSLLKERAKQQQTTVHCVLSAAISLTMAAEFASDESNCLLHRSAVNLRSELDPEVGDEIGLFVSLLLYREQLTGSEDLWDIASSIQKQLQLGRERNSPLAIVRLMPALYRSVRGEKLSNEELSKRWREKTRETSGLTNLGVIDLPTRVGDLEIEAFHVAVSPSSLVDFATTAATFNGQLIWNFICPYRVFEKSHAEQLVDKIVARLRAAIQS